MQRDPITTTEPSEKDEADDEELRERAQAAVDRINFIQTNEYELKHMKQAPPNMIMANGGIKITQALVTTPEAKSRIKNIIIRSYGTTEFVLWIRGCFIKYLMVSRTLPNLRSAMRATKFKEIKAQDDQMGRINGDKKARPNSADSSASGCPFTGGVRYVPRLFDIKQLYPRGYKSEELGLLAFFGKGLQACPVTNIKIAPRNNE
ncbi:hypothetical protein BGX27_009820 [Mortierella sp. AM989]|nr:hypothetical protein BGX27_009820 [Mortierella sp. AM989]